MGHTEDRPDIVLVNQTLDWAGAVCRSARELGLYSFSAERRVDGEELHVDKGTPDSDVDVRIGEYHHRKAGWTIPEVVLLSRPAPNSEGERE